MACATIYLPRSQCLKKCSNLRKLQNICESKLRSTFKTVMIAKQPTQIQLPQIPSKVYKKVLPRKEIALTALFRNLKGEIGNSHFNEYISI